MADAKKCDICGKLYEVYTTKSRLLEETVNGFRFGVDGVTTRHKWNDCCVECLTSIEDHIKSLRGEEDKKENPHRCDTCVWQDSGSEECKQCITNAEDPNCTPSMWSPKEELVATHIWRDEFTRRLYAKLTDGRNIEIMQVQYLLDGDVGFEEWGTCRPIKLAPECKFGEGALDICPIN